MKEKPVRFRTISDEANFIGTAILNLKIFNILQKIQVYVVDKKISNYDILLGLDIIKLFKLRQEENLEISQASSNNTSLKKYILLIIENTILLKIMQTKKFLKS